MNLRSLFSVHLPAVSMLGPLTTPEHQISKTPSSSSLSSRMMNKITPKYVTNPLYMHLVLARSQRLGLLTSRCLTC